MGKQQFEHQKGAVDYENQNVQVRMKYKSFNPFADKAKRTW